MDFTELYEMAYTIAIGKDKLKIKKLCNFFNVFAIQYHKIYKKRMYVEIKSMLWMCRRLNFKAVQQNAKVQQ